MGRKNRAPEGDKGALPQTYALALIALVIGGIALYTWFSKPSELKDGFYIVYSESCPYCRALKAYLDENNYPYSFISPSQAARIASSEGVNWKGTIPFVIAKKGEGYMFMLGFPREREDGYAIGESEEWCERMNGTPFQEDNTYLFCVVDGIVQGNEHAVNYIYKRFLS